MKVWYCIIQQLNKQKVNISLQFMCYMARYHSKVWGQYNFFVCLFVFVKNVNKRMSLMVTKAACIWYMQLQ